MRFPVTIEATGDQVAFYNCAFRQINTGNYTTTLIQATGYEDLSFVNCTFESAYSNTFNNLVYARNAKVINCIAKTRGNALNLFADSRSCIVLGNIVTCPDPTTQTVKDGIRVSGSVNSGFAVVVKGNCVYKAGDAIELDSVPDTNEDSGMILANNIIWDCTNGFNCNEASQHWPVHFYNNAVGGASSARYDSVFDSDQVVGDVTLTVNPWIDPDNGDFRLNDAPDGGALCRVDGMPGAHWHSDHDRYQDRATGPIIIPRPEYRIGWSD